MKKYIKENIIYIIIIIITILLTQIKLPYYINTPGGIIDITSRIEYNNKEKTKGTINLLYVKEYVATIPSYLLSYIMPDWDIEKLEDNQLTSNETVDEIDKRNRVMLDNSINNAMYVAYKAANKNIEIKEKHNMIIGVTLDNGFKIGDEVLTLEGKEITDVKEVREKIKKLNKGDKLKFQVIRNNKKIDIESTIKEVNGQKALGVVMITNYEYKTTPEIKIAFKKSESGSSGGLMLTLCIYNAISDKDILKGRKIAGTGTIDNEGNVGEIAGIKYKIIGAHNNKMDIVFVPSANYKEAIKVAKKKKYNMEIVKVDTFNDVIEYLEK